MKKLKILKTARADWVHKTLGGVIIIPYTHIHKHSAVMTKETYSV